MEEKKTTRVDRQTLTKNDRLLKRSEYLRLLNLGKRKNEKHFLISFHPNSVGRTRLGVTVTKKIGTAVTRNRIKRVVREFFRKNRQMIKGGWDINIVAKKSTVDLEPYHVSENLTSLFNKIPRGLNH